GRVPRRRGLSFPQRRTLPAAAAHHARLARLRSAHGVQGAAAEMDRRLLSARRYSAPAGAGPGLRPAGRAVTCRRPVRGGRICPRARPARESMSTTPIIVLSHPQLGENIGAAARAMANFGLSELRLVAPQCPWPSERALAMAVTAKAIVEQAKVYPTLRE